jgi:hypothetical protein
MTSRQYDAIDERVADMILALHKAHPKLGHHGLLEALKQSDVHVNPKDLDAFMKKKRIKAQRDWRPWKWRGWTGQSLPPSDQ